MNIPQNLTEYLESYFGNYLITPASAGETDAQLFNIKFESNFSYFLKYQKSSLKNDYLNYTWLQGKVPVPQVLFYEQFNNYEAICMTALKGYPLSNYIGKVEDTEIVRRYAKALKQLHSLVIDKDALHQDLTSRVLQARYNIENDLVDTSYLQPENQGISFDKLFKNLMAIQPTTHEQVFTHGDYCFDNLIFDMEKFSGFIDLDKGGVADKYQDIALAVRSIRDDLDESLVDLFFVEYGLSEIDHRKITFYTLLDEFF
jgi:aminoglycoside phosphotransferase